MRFFELINAKNLINIYIDHNLTSEFVNYIPKLVNLRNIDIYDNSHSYFIEREQN